MTTQERLAQTLFPDITTNTAFYEALFPKRQLKEGARVTRFAPSPTGSMHLGNLFVAYMSVLTARATDGIFLLRIEDTDKKREIDDGVALILSGLSAFGIAPDEGVTGTQTQVGDYGPYQQSHRKQIYQSVAKDLVLRDLAYPCFCTPAELEDIRTQQEAQGVNKGYYGQWASCRTLPIEAVEANLKAGKSFVLRLKSPGTEETKCYFDDFIRGKIEMPENIQDIVLLKTDGIPTYHFAHAVDDHFMGVTHVIRGDEWIASIPIHLQLFKVCGFKPPKYAHIAPIMKEDDGNKRKLSKRKDPEAAVSYYAEQGYPAESVKEYLLTLANSNFEDWHKANKGAPLDAFPFNLKKMSVSGALFDLMKLNDISKNSISVQTAQNVFDASYQWAKQHSPALASLYAQDHSFACAILNIDRENTKPRKDLAKWSDILDNICYFYDTAYVPNFVLPDHIDAALASEVLAAYQIQYDESDDKTTWFEKIKNLCPLVGCTPNVKEYKANPTDYRGHVGDVSTILRVAVTGRQNTPDLHAIMALLGQDIVTQRLQQAAAHYTQLLSL